MVSCWDLASLHSRGHRRVSKKLLRSATVVVLDAPRPSLNFWPRRSVWVDQPEAVPDGEGVTDWVGVDDPVTVVDGVPEGVSDTVGCKGRR